MAGKLRSWVFTLNNPLEVETTSIKQWVVSRLVVGQECGESKTPHLQGAVTFKAAYRLSGLKKLLQRAHWEPMKARGNQAFDYCRKEGNIVYDVDNRKQGHRSDLDKVQEAVMAGATETQLWQEHYPAMVRYHQAILRSRFALNPPLTTGKHQIDAFQWPRLELKLPTIIWGKPGIGKTQFALAHFKRPLLVRHMDDLGNLMDHDGIVFDDMDFNHMPRTAQIHLVDWELPSSIHIRYKTATIPAQMPRIFTTNTEDGTILLTADDAIARRVKIIHLNKFF